jgi:hypothetical protein
MKLGTIANQTGSFGESSGAKLDRHESFVRAVELYAQAELAGPLESESRVVLRVAHEHDRVVT